MRSTVIGTVGGVIALGVALAAFAAAPRSAVSHSRADGATAAAVVSQEIDSLAASLDGLDSALTLNRGVRGAFRRARIHYKHLEPVVEFYSPALAAAINSRRQEVDDDDAPPPSSLAPSGFPVLEAAVFPAYRADARARAIAAVGGLRLAVKRLRWLATGLTMSDAQLFELARLEVVRISTLGIAEFDAPMSGDALLECGDALDGLRALFATVGPTRWPGLGTERAELDRTLAAASAYLRAHSDANTSDRFTLIVDVLTPVARDVRALRLRAGTPPLTMPRPLKAETATPYEANAFDVMAYAPSGAAQMSIETVRLGKMLFGDPRLSGPGTRACASCHQPSHAFSDGLPKAASIEPHAPPVARNTPTLINAALQPEQFADERAGSLEGQIDMVLRSPSEMAGSPDDAAARLAHDSTYRAAFARAFGVPSQQAVTPLRLRQALATYVRTLVATNSRFDRAVRGDASALTGEERRGFTLFMGKGRCGSCHFAPLFGGTTPPLYRTSDVEVIGTPASPSRPTIVDADSGRARVDGQPIHLRAFKTPSVRNVALTAPYMHNGTFHTLEQVVAFYNHGGAVGAGARLGEQTLAPDSLHLSAGEQRAIIAFLGTLTDTVIGERGATKK